MTGRTIHKTHPEEWAGIHVLNEMHAFVEQPFQN